MLTWIRDLLLWRRDPVKRALTLAGGGVVGVLAKGLQDSREAQEDP